MKEIAERAEQAAKEMQMIANNLGDYNPGLCKDKVPLGAIQYDLDCLERELIQLRIELGRRSKNDNDI